MMSELSAPPSANRRVFHAMLSSVKSICTARSGSAAAVQALLTKFGVLGLNVATSIVVARALRPAGRGAMSAMILWPGFLAALLTLGLPSSLTYNLRRFPERAAATLSAAWLLSLAIGLFTGVVGYLAVPVWLTHYTPTEIGYARWMLLASPLPILLLVGRAAQEARGNFLASNFSLWLAPFLTLVGLIGLLAVHAVTPLTSGLAYVLASVPAALILVSQLLVVYPVHLSDLRPALGGLLHFGLRAWGIDLLNALAVSEQVLVVHFLSAADMGTYVVAASLARMLSVFQTSAIVVLFPRIAARDKSDVIELTGKVFRVTTLCAGVCALVAGALGPTLLRVVYGGSYADRGANAFRVLLIEVVLSGATQVLAQAFLALERPGSVTLIQGIGVGLGLLLMPGLIRHFGSVGAPLALMISSVIRISITLIAFRPLLKSPGPRILPGVDDFRFLLDRLISLRGGKIVTRSEVPEPIPS